jgi:hypothetical protein
MLLKMKLISTVYLVIAQVFLISLGGKHNGRSKSR